jgi:hypothetical protein
LPAATDAARLADMADTQWTNRLPEGLPRGRFVAPARWDQEHQRHVEDPAADPVMWLTDKPLRDAPDLWRQLFSDRATTGLYPLLLRGLGKNYDDPEQDRPWRAGELQPVDPSDVADIDIDKLLAELWDRATDTVDPSARAGMLARHEIPYLGWPGPAVAGPAIGTPDDVAIRVAASLRDCMIGLVPAATGADAIVTCGWIGPCNYATTAEVVRVLRSWQERFGIHVVGVGFQTLVLSTAAPPDSQASASRVAAEHHAFCWDTIY